MVQKTRYSRREWWKKRHYFIICQRRRILAAAAAGGPILVLLLLPLLMDNHIFFFFQSLVWETTMLPLLAGGGVCWGEQSKQIGTPLPNEWEKRERKWELITLLGKAGDTFSGKSVFTQSKDSSSILEKEKIIN